MSLAIKVEGVSKAYQLGTFSSGTLGQDLQRWWASLRGAEDPLLKLGEENDRTIKGKSDVVWSLKDIDFQISQGDAVGIIGKNGAGKSTLLKILSQVTSPTTGKVKVKGRIASLLEVGTGFHPELTGRENIFLNGAILGMRKKEIKDKFDEIVDFSGVERYIDTPVKRYSSGMYVRLAFAVAAHLESEILIVDEVLAVGDADFQKKCLGKMGDISKGKGRTILFVSHNMASIRAFCSKGIYLNNGNIKSVGHINDIISEYLSSNQPKIQADDFISDEYRLHGTGEARFLKLALLSEKLIPKQEFFFKEKVLIKFQIQTYKVLENVIVAWHLVNMFGDKIAMDVVKKSFEPIHLKEGIYEFSIVLEEILMPGDYSINLSASFFHTGSDIDYLENVKKFKVVRESIQKGADYPWTTVHGYFQPKSEWDIKKLN